MRLSSISLFFAILIIKPTTPEQRQVHLDANPRARVSIGTGRAKTKVPESDNDSINIGLLHLRDNRKAAHVHHNVVELFSVIPVQPH